MCPTEVDASGDLADQPHGLDIVHDEVVAECRAHLREVTQPLTRRARHRPVPQNRKRPTKHQALADCFHVARLGKAAQSRVHRVGPETHLVVVERHRPAKPVDGVESVP